MFVESNHATYPTKRKGLIPKEDKKESILSVHARAFLEEQAGDCCIQPCSVAAVSDHNHSDLPPKFNINDLYLIGGM